MASESMYEIAARLERAKLRALLAPDTATTQVPVRLLEDIAIFLPEPYDQKTSTDLQERIGAILRKVTTTEQVSS